MEIAISGVERTLSMCGNGTEGQFCEGLTELVLVVQTPTKVAFAVYHQAKVKKHLFPHPKEQCSDVEVGYLNGVPQWPWLVMAL